MNVLRGVLYFFAGVFVLVPLVWIKLAGFGLFGGIALAAGAGLAYVTFQQARKFNVQQSDNQKAQLETTYRSLAAKNAGVVSMSQLLNATGLSKDQLQHDMRELVGRGVCDLDFSANGEMQYKLSPIDNARAELAQFAESSGPNKQQLREKQ